MPSKVGRKISGLMGAKDCCNRRLEFCNLFGQGNLTFIREKSGNFEN